VAGNGSTENHFQLIWDLDKENVTMEEIKDKLLFATNCEGNTAMQFDRKWGKQDLLLVI
jgi:endo-1,4-beta-D-glucanase Y